MLFYVLNILVIPGLVIFHLVLVTSPKKHQWSQRAFIPYLFSRLVGAITYNVSFITALGKGMKSGVDGDKFIIWKKVLIGVIISFPVLAVVVRLLMAADSQFDRLVGDIPNWFQVVDGEGIARIVLVIIFMMAFFGLMQFLYHKQMKVFKQKDIQQIQKLDSVITITVLVLINAVYILFTIVQFKYFFSGSLQMDYTYAEYARKGFFELLFVTLINLTLSTVVLSLGGGGKNGIKRMRQTMLTILVLSSAVMLISAFIRLSMYEDAYGFTFTRVLVHSFMIFLVVILGYTLVKIWIEKLSLFRFYFIASIFYYTAISVVNLDRMVVNENIQRYQVTGKIDVYYLKNLSYTGVIGLIHLYEKDKRIPELRNILINQRREAINANLPWQSYNLKREQAHAKLNNLDIE